MARRPARAAVAEGESVSKSDHSIDGWLCREKKSVSSYCFFPGQRPPIIFRHRDGKRVSWDGQSLGATMWFGGAKFKGLIPQELAPGEGPIRVRIRMEVLTP